MTRYGVMRSAGGRSPPVTPSFDFMSSLSDLRLEIFFQFKLFWILISWPKIDQNHKICWKFNFLRFFGYFSTSSCLNFNFFCSLLPNSVFFNESNLTKSILKLHNLVGGRPLRQGPKKKKRSLAFQRAMSHCLIFSGSGDISSVEHNLIPYL